jgi:hypothetical protein
LEERRGIGWWKVGITRLKEMRGRRKDRVTSCDVKEHETGGTNCWGKFHRYRPGNRKITSNKIKDIRSITGHSLKSTKRNGTGW